MGAGRLVFVALPLTLTLTTICSASVFGMFVSAVGVTVTRTV
jgi:hypothetical protein